MEAPSFVSKARTAFHSAAAKADRLLSDLKTERPAGDSDNQSPKTPTTESRDESTKPEVLSKSQHEPKNQRWRPPPIGTKHDWQERLKNIRIHRKEVEDSDKAESATMSFPIYDENQYMPCSKNDLEEKGETAISLVNSLNSIDTEKIPSSSVIKQIAIAVESGKKFKSLKDFMVSSKDSSPVRERASLALSAMKSLMLREKDEKLTSQLYDDNTSVINLLFDSGGNFLRRKICWDSENVNTTFFPREIHAAPPESLVVKLSEVMGSFKTLRKMALFWCAVIDELRRLWFEGKHIPGIPLDMIPDLKCCHVYQQLQVINCCISRKSQRAVATESLESVIREASSTADESSNNKDRPHASKILYARVSSGELFLRLGAEHQSDSLTLLETGEPVYSPVTQEGPLLTEDLIKETEELVLRTGSVGAGCSQLLSDMQAFKAANPGCILEDFVRWHSPPDWTETELTSETKDCDGGDLSMKGQLSRRMQKEGNLWRELWETAKPVPAVKQAPLFDEDLAVDGILNVLEEIPPAELFEQLFLSLLAEGFVIAEATLLTDNNFSKLFYECKDYVIATCKDGSIWTEKIDELCQVYETVETMLLNPEEVIKLMKQHVVTSTSLEEPKRGFKRLSLHFGLRDKQLRKPASKSQDPEETSSRQPFNFFDRKSSMFSKKPPKHEIPSPGEKSTPVENDWTMV